MLCDFFFLKKKCIYFAATQTLRIHSCHALGDLSSETEPEFLDLTTACLPAQGTD